MVLIRSPISHFSPPRPQGTVAPRESGFGRHHSMLPLYGVVTQVACAWISRLGAPQPFWHQGLMNGLLSGGWLCVKDYLAGWCKRLPLPPHSEYFQYSLPDKPCDGWHYGVSEASQSVRSVEQSSTRVQFGGKPWIASTNCGFNGPPICSLSGRELRAIVSGLAQPLFQSLLVGVGNSLTA